MRVTEVIVVTLGGILAAALIAVVLVRRHRPAEGYLTWLRETFRPAALREVITPLPVDDDGDDLHVQDLLEFAEDGTGYAVAPDLRTFGRSSTAA